MQPLDSGYWEGFVAVFMIGGGLAGFGLIVAVCIVGGIRPEDRKWVFGGLAFMFVMCWALAISFALFVPHEPFPPESSGPPYTTEASFATGALATVYAVAFAMALTYPIRG